MRSKPGEDAIFINQFAGQSGRDPDVEQSVWNKAISNSFQYNSG
jgi:hypothetical protein